MYTVSSLWTDVFWSVFGGFSQIVNAEFMLAHDDVQQKLGTVGSCSALIILHFTTELNQH